MKLIKEFKDRLGRLWYFICILNTDEFHIVDTEDIIRYFSKEVKLRVVAIREDYEKAMSLTYVVPYDKHRWSNDQYIEDFNEMFDYYCSKLKLRVPAMWYSYIQYPKCFSDMRDPGWFNTPAHVALVNWKPKPVVDVPVYPDKIKVNSNLIYIGDLGKATKKNFNILEEALIPSKLSGYRKYYGTPQQAHIINLNIKDNDEAQKFFTIYDRAGAPTNATTKKWNMFRDVLFGVNYDAKKHYNINIYNAVKRDINQLIEEGVTLVLLTSPHNQQTLAMGHGFDYVAVISDTFKVPYDIISAEEYEIYRKSEYSDFAKNKKYYGKKGQNKIILTDIQEESRVKLMKYNDVFGEPDSDYIMQYPDIGINTANDSYKAVKMIERVAYAATDDESGADGAHLEPMLGDRSIKDRKHADVCNQILFDMVNAFDYITSKAITPLDDPTKLLTMSREHAADADSINGVVMLRCPNCRHSYRSVHRHCTVCGLTNVFYDVCENPTGRLQAAAELTISFETEDNRPKIIVGNEVHLDIREVYPDRTDILILFNNRKQLPNGYSEALVVAKAQGTANCSDPMADLRYAMANDAVASTQYTSNKSMQTAQDWMDTDEMSYDAQQALLDEETKETFESETDIESVDVSDAFDESESEE